MMIYVFGDLRQLRSFELARVPDSGTSASSTKTEKDKKPAHIVKLPSSHHAQEHSADSKGSSIQPLTGPPPPLFRHSVFSESATPPHSPTTDAPVSPLSRPPPPKLRVVAPPTAHTYTHIHTSSRAEFPETNASPIAFASTSYSPSSAFARDRSGMSDFVCDLGDDYTDSDSDYESDCDPDPDAT